MSYWNNRHLYFQLLQAFTDNRLPFEDFVSQFNSQWRIDRDAETLAKSSTDFKMADEDHRTQKAVLDELLSEIFCACDIFEPDESIRLDYEYDEASLKNFVKEILKNNQDIFLDPSI